LGLAANYNLLHCGKIRTHVNFLDVARNLVMDWNVKLRGIAFRWLHIRLFLLIEQDIGFIPAWNFHVPLEVIKCLYFFMLEKRLGRIAFKFCW
jgi:hypothetical protein